MEAVDYLAFFSVCLQIRRGSPFKLLPGTKIPIGLSWAINGPCHPTLMLRPPTTKSSGANIAGCVSHSPTHPPTHPPTHTHTQTTHIFENEVSAPNQDLLFQVQAAQVVLGATLCVKCSTQHPSKNLSEEPFGNCLAAAC